MGRNRDKNLTPTQLEIMHLFWEHGELGVAQVWKMLGSRRELARNTVQTTLTRLADRGWLRARQEGNAFIYRAARARKSTLGGLIGDLVDDAFSGSASGMVMALLQTRKITPDEARKIRELIDEAQKGES